MLVLGRIVCTLLSVVLPATCSALEIRRVQTCSGMVLRLRGDIYEGDFSRLKAHFRGKEASRRASVSQILHAAKSLPSMSAANAAPFARMFFLLERSDILESMQRSVSMLFLTIKISKTPDLNF